MVLLMSKVKSEENVIFISWEQIPRRVEVEGKLLLGRGHWYSQSVRQPSRAVLLRKLRQTQAPTTWHWATLQRLRPPYITTTSPRSYTSGTPRSLTLLTNWLQILEFLLASSSVILQNDSEHRKVLSLKLQFYHCKGCKSEPPQRRDT